MPGNDDLAVAGSRSTTLVHDMMCIRLRIGRTAAAATCVTPIVVTTAAATASTSAIVAASASAAWSGFATTAALTAVTERTVFAVGAEAL